MTLEQHRKRRRYKIRLLVEQVERQRSALRQAESCAQNRTENVSFWNERARLEARNLDELETMLEKARAS